MNFECFKIQFIIRKKLAQMKQLLFHKCDLSQSVCDLQVCRFISLSVYQSVGLWVCRFISLSVGWDNRIGVTAGATVRRGEEPQNLYQGGEEPQNLYQGHQGAPANWYWQTPSSQHCKQILIGWCECHSLIRVSRIRV